MAEEGNKWDNNISAKGKESRTNSPTNSKGKKRENAKSSSKIEKGKKIVDGSDHEVHIWTERERRKKMRNMFSTLQAYLPQLPQKVDKATIVEEAVNYIKNLEENLKTLEKRKLDKKKPSSATSSSIVSPDFSSSRGAFFSEQSDELVPITSPLQKPCLTMQTWTSQNVVLSIAGPNAFINVCAPKKLGLISATAYFLEKHGAEAVSVQVFSDSISAMFLMRARINGDNEVCGDETRITLIEEKFKLAMGELILWLSSSTSK